MHWKIARDRYYRGLYQRFGQAFIDEAGFFHDTSTTDAGLDDLRWLSTPTTHLHRNLDAAPSRPAVLVCTGAFCPVHTGHLELMESARTAVEAAGYRVVGGYLSPGHDEYLRLKLGDAALSPSHRLALCGRAVADSDWLMVDPWEALGCAVAVNFTDVVARLETYLQQHVRSDITLFYVCGADNARFALTFVERGHCVVAGRAGSQAQLSTYREHPLVRDLDRIVWSPKPHTGSSTQARSGDASVVPAAIRDHLGDHRPSRLSLRLEGPEVVWPGHEQAWARFRAGLCAIFEGHFELERVDQGSQRAPRGLATISLDPLTAGDHQLALSRLFDLGGYVQRGQTARPGTPDLAEQLATIPPGRYHLFDDDQCSGSTLQRAARSMPADVVIAEVSTLLGRPLGSEPREIADARDFLLGSRDGGLVVTLPDGALGRAPYLLPYVDPAPRCSVPADQVLEFSTAVWTLNLEFFRGSSLAVSDLPGPARQTLRVAGFGDRTSLASVCTWHLDRLAALA
jgi:nicotinic acid mononucleotide adenylyltransferase